MITLFLHISRDSLLSEWLRLESRSKGHNHYIHLSIQVRKGSDKKSINDSIIRIYGSLYKSSNAKIILSSLYMMYFTWKSHFV